MTTSLPLPASLRAVGGEGRASERLLHNRSYDVESWLEDDDHFRLIGRMQDVKVHGFTFIPDDDPITMHDMVVELVIEAPAMIISAADVQMRTHPHDECPNILAIYQQLVGMSITRGFVPKVREMFGGPRACTHIAAMLMAMAPVAVQSMWGFMERTGRTPPVGSPGREAGLERNRDTCHVWATDGPLFTRIDRGEPVGMPRTMQDRLRSKGIDPDTFQPLQG